MPRLPVLLALSMATTFGIVGAAGAERLSVANGSTVSIGGLFRETSHDFGSVARAAKIEHRFTFTNTTDRELHIAGVRSSCGCTSPRVDNQTIKPGEEGAVIAAFNTRAFTGQRGATVTVTFDKPYYTEVQFQVRGYIRTDVVVDPPQADLGNIDQGAPVEKVLSINYAGRNDWKITEVKPDSPFVTAEVVEKSRSGGRVGYDLVLRVAPDAPIGYLKDSIWLTTNDQRSPRFPVAVEGNVTADIAVSPTSLMLGEVHPGETIRKQIVVKGRSPFRVLNVDGGDAFAFRADSDSKAVHLIAVVYTVPSLPGPISARLLIETDLTNHAVIEIPAIGNVSSPLAGHQSAIR